LTNARRGRTYPSSGREGVGVPLGSPGFDLDRTGGDFVDGEGAGESCSFRPGSNR
jgi:hypothetical protein